MTREQIENMPAGQEMDEAVTRLLSPDAKAIIIMPKYSTDIKAAWEIVESFKDNWIVEVGMNDSFYWCDMENYKGIWGLYSARAKTAPLAICRAFLLYKMEVK